MSNGALARIAAKTAAEVCRQVALGEEAAKLLRPDLAPRQYLDLLIGKEHFRDAARFLAHALPKREAVWWACVCVRQSHGGNLPARAQAAVQAAEKWAADPSEDNRRAAQPAAEAADVGTPAGCVAMAAFWSGGSMAPPAAPAVPPPEYLTAEGVTGAVLLAVVRTEPEKAVEKYRKFLALGIDVASGASRWK